MTSTFSGRWAWADVDLDAIAHNMGVLRRAADPAAVWAVVKADGYGHGAVQVSNAALAAGAAGLGVALVEEGIELREAGIAADIVVLSQQPPEQAGDILAHRLIPTVYTSEGIKAIAAAARGTAYPVHLKIDTGMHRVGASPSEAVRLAEEVHVAGLQLAGIFTHLAVADEPANPYTDVQLQRFDAVLAELARSGHQPLLIHAANSAGTLAHPSAHRSLVRAGIALYGIEPGPELAMAASELRPAMSLRARVAHVKRVAAGDRISYGLRHTFDAPASVATVPIGYADGVPRRLGLTGGEVLIGGRRCRIAGVVTMDQLTVDVGDAPVVVGEEVVLIGRQGQAEIRAEEWAQRLGTIPYEVVCGISKRVPRRHHGEPGGAGADRH